MTYEWIFYSCLLMLILAYAGLILKAVREDRRDADREAEQRRFYETIHRVPRPMYERASQGFEKRREG